MKDQGIGRTTLTDWVLRGLLLFGAIIWLTLVAGSWAEANDSYDFKWLDPDKKVYVLQNRRFVKANRLSISFLPGISVSAAFQNIAKLGGRIGYHFTEDLGVEAFVNYNISDANTTLIAFQGASPSGRVIVHQPGLQWGGLIEWSPWYAKINVFNAILYFDWYFSVGGGTSGITILDVKRSSESVMNVINPLTIYAATGHQFHITENFFARLEMMGAYYMAPLFGDSGVNAWFTDYSFTLGAGIRL